MLLILSCLGAAGEYVLWDSEKDREMDEKEWKRRKYLSASKLSIWHRTCNTVASTCIEGLRNGQSIGCTCHSSQARQWRHRRSEVVQFGKDRGFTVETTEDDWVKECTGKNYKPRLRCRHCNELVTSTSLTNMSSGHNIGCKCHLDYHWRRRRHEVVAWGNERGFEVITTEDEWLDECDGNDYKPRLRCQLCKEMVTSTPTATSDVLATPITPITGAIADPKSSHGGINVGLKS